MDKTNIKQVHGTEGTVPLECLDRTVPVYALRWGFADNEGATGSAAFGVSYYETLFAHEPGRDEMAKTIASWLRTVTTPSPVEVDGHPVWYEPEERASLESYLQNTTGTVRLRSLEGYLKELDAAVALRILREMNQYAVSLETWLQGKERELLSCEDAEGMNEVDLEAGKPGAISLQTDTLSQEIETAKENDPNRKAARLAQLMVNKVQLTPAEALELQVLFPVWGEEGAEFGVTRPAGFRFRYEGTLYEFTMESWLQADWIPSEVPTYKVVQTEHAGTQDDPIPWAQKMELYEGKYYTDQGVLYKCTRSSGQAMAFDLKDLVGLYVEAL